MRLIRFSILAASVLILGGCTWQKTSEPVVLKENPLTKFQADSAALGDNLQLEGEIRKLFSDSNTNSSVLFVYPMTDYTTNKTAKTFGQLIPKSSDDRFSGYHSGDDIEVGDKAAAVPVYALTNATLVQKNTISGYGGVVILSFVDNDITYHALYGHLDLSSVTAKVGDGVLAGMKIGELGDDQSEETDGERKHLHFAIFPFTGTELVAGYVESDTDLQRWVDPSTFLRERGAILP